jgi:transcriptional regulator with XRE-family HTH domain
VSPEEERGRLITQLREQRLWTREKLAKEAGVSPTTVAQAEEGRTHIRLGTIGKLGRALEVNPQVLLHPKGAAPPSPLRAEASEERREREKYAEALMEQWTEAGEYLAEEIKSSPKGFPLGRAHLFGLGRDSARVLYEEIESTRHPPKALQEAKSRLDEQGELISSLWRQTIHPESGEELDEFKRFATRRAEASLREVDEEGAHSSPRESESSA